MLPSLPRGRRASQRDAARLRLAIVRMIVVNHGGEVDLVSREGAGTTVPVRLPLLSQAGA